MGAPLSQDLRARVIRAVARGASRRQAAARFGVSASTAVRWVAEWQRNGRMKPLSQGGDRRSARVEAEAEFLLEQVSAQPGTTLREYQAMLQERGVAVGIGTIWRFFDRRGLPLEKRRGGRRADR